MVALVGQYRCSQDGEGEKSCKDMHLDDELTSRVVDA